VRTTSYIAYSIQCVRNKAGSRTSGIDGKKLKSTYECLALKEEINYKIIDSYKGTSLRRINIFKAKKKTRLLGIPTTKDRVIQELYRMFLDPIIEETADPNSFGFRKGRSAHHAIAAVARVTRQKSKTRRKS